MKRHMGRRRRPSAVAAAHPAAAAAAGRGGPGRGAAVLAGRFAPLLLPPFAPVPALPDLDVAVLLFESGGEDVGAVVAADEIQVGNVRRPRRGLQAGGGGGGGGGRRRTGG